MTNFSPLSRAEISARLSEQIFLKRRLRLHEESFSPVKRAEKPHVIAFKFQPGLKYEPGHCCVLFQVINIQKLQNFKGQLIRYSPVHEFMNCMEYICCRSGPKLDIFVLHNTYFPSFTKRKITSSSNRLAVFITV